MHTISGDAQQLHPLSRKASQANTRARLIAVGREHFLRDGLGGAVAERIATEAGFTRGAFYANFDNKDELFVAVVQSTVDAEQQNFRVILESDEPAAVRFDMLRKAVGDMVTNPTWVRLQVEFQANALRSESIRMAYIAQQQRRRAAGAALLEQCARELDLVLSGTPEEVVGVLGSLTEGLAVRQAILGQPDVEKARQLSMLCFDRLVAARMA